MSGHGSWAAWQLDAVTWGWIFWLGWFVALETYALWNGDGDALTNHLRPVFLSFPVVWWIAAGLWLWLGVHLLAPALERGLLDLVRG